MSCTTSLIISTLDTVDELEKPVTPLTAVAIIAAIWIEGLFDSEAKGPPFYKEKRISQGKAFNLYKFRVLKMPVIEKMTESDSATFLQVDKKNTTRVGRLVIKCYFDEMPQLFSVLSGKISLIGPRPRIRRVYEEDLKKVLGGIFSGLNELISKKTTGACWDRARTC